jgi:lysophospholipase L1-like esterase
MSRFAAAVLLVVAVVGRVGAHESGLPINTALGVPGFPQCVRAHPESALSVEEAAQDLICSQKNASDDAIKIACVGDSITAGVCSSGGDHPYPQQLQILLDQAHGQGKYSVTNLGACGATMLKGGDSPYWKRSQFSALTSGKWDIVTIMLGTNDAKDPGSHGPNNWHHDCGGPTATKLEGCAFADSYKDMIDLVKTLGTTPAGPKIYALIPPALNQQGAYGMNQTVINSVFPKLVPLIQKANNVLGPIDIYTGMGGVPDWQSKMPDHCTLNSSWTPCKYWCDSQHCDQCHPNDNGYSLFAQVLLKGLGLDNAVVV